MNISSKSTSGIVLISFIIIAITLSVHLSSGHVDDNKNRKLYIAYMGSLPADANYAPAEHHLTILQKVVSGHGNQLLYHSYGRSFNGFAAWLTDQERDKLKDMEGVISVIPSEPMQLHTTRSWDFMGFPEDAQAHPTLAASDIIIGVIDSGIWPGLKSFNDQGLGPVPKKWKGSCQGGPNFKCNRKIIGARFYRYLDNAWDQVGHGTHTASVAAGSKVKDASFNESTLAKGTARGGAPSSRIAAYKVCGLTICESANILAAFDDAIADGVDVIAIPIGVDAHVIIPYFSRDPTAIGSFHAMANGIVTINSAGNTGPFLEHIHFLAPWLVSVGASSIDRSFITKVVLGNGKNLTGRSINLHSLGNEAKYPLTYAFNESCRVCLPYCIDKDMVVGKIVMCRRTLPPINLDYFKELGAAGVIIESIKDFPKIQHLPAVAMPPQEFRQLEAYAESSEPRATILASEEAKDPLAPLVASFSSRGPNYRFPDILKPDVVAPGISILAAYPPEFFPSENRKSQQEYNIMSGTSVSCGHVAGTIAYLKSLHPNWSPAALKSAIMTTALPLNASMHPAQEFSYGSGHIDPAKAADPGLIYEISKQDYIGVVCGTYDDKTCLAISGQDCQCSKNKIAAKDLNYPSMTATVNAIGPFNVSFTRVVTNVGHPNSTYKAKITAAEGLKITVVPDALTFKELNEKKSFEVQVTGEYPSKRKLMLSSLLVWSHGTHSVRSPIIVYYYYKHRK